MAKSKEQRVADRNAAIAQLKKLVTPYTKIVAFQHEVRSNSKGQFTFSFLISENIQVGFNQEDRTLTQIRNITDHILCLFSEKKRYRWFYRSSEPHEIMSVLAKCIFTEEEIQSAGFESLSQWAGNMMERIY